MALIQSIATPNRILIGDTLNYQITIDHNPGDRVEVSSQNFSPYTCLGVSINVKEASTEISYILQGFNPADSYIPTQDILIHTKSASPKHLLVPAYFVEIKSAFSATEDRHLQPTYTLSINVSAWILCTTLFIVLACIAGLVFFLKKRKKTSQIQENTPLKSPLETALEALEILKHQHYISKGLLKEHYIRLTEILKQYFESQYHISLLDQTTNESLKTLKPILEEQQLRRVKYLFTQSDFIKFAKWVPESEEHEELFQKAKDILQKENP